MADAKNKPVLDTILTTADISAWFEDNQLPPSVAEASFPLTYNKTKTWKTRSNSVLMLNEAADPISLNSKVPVSGRNGFKDIMGDMATFGKGREWDADEIEEFERLKMEFATMKNPAIATRLLDYYGKDLDFIRNAMRAEQSYLCWALVSNACNIQFLAAHSPYMQGLTAMDYGVATWQKDNVATSWSAPAALILDDIESILNVGETYSKNFTTIKVNKKWFNYIRKNTQIQKYCATLVSNLFNTQAPPTLEAVNGMLAGYFSNQIVRIEVVDEKITRALRNDSKTTLNPFADGVAIFSQTPVLGRFEWNDIPIIDGRETPESFFIVGNYRNIDPNYSKIYAKGRAFPVVDTYADNFYLKIDAVAW